jgi:hypothetical protein
MAKEKPIPVTYTAPKFKFLKTWQEHKKEFEKNTNKKKPSEKGFFGLYRKSAGIEPAFKLLDKVLAEVPAPIPDNALLKLYPHPLQYSIQLEENANRQLAWVKSFDKAFNSFTTNCAAYEKLLDKSTDDDEYKLFAKDVKILKAALKTLVKKATVCSYVASAYHKLLTKICNTIDGSNRHFTTISVEVQAFNTMLKEYGIKPLIDENSATLKKDLTTALASIKRASDSKKAGAAPSSTRTKPAVVAKKVTDIEESIEQASRFLEGMAVRVNESFSAMMDGFDAD